MDSLVQRGLTEIGLSGMEGSTLKELATRLSSVERPLDVQTLFFLWKKLLHFPQLQHFWVRLLFFSFLFAPPFLLLASSCIP